MTEDEDKGMDTKNILYWILGISMLCVCLLTIVTFPFTAGISTIVGLCLCASIIAGFISVATVPF